MWEWVYIMSEKSTERVRKWRIMNEERKKELDRKASKAYWDRNKDNQEFRDRKREQARRSAINRYPAKRAAMTPEQLEEVRRKNRERMRARRAAEKAQKEKENEGK